MNFKLAQDKETGGREITTPTSQLISCLVPTCNGILLETLVSSDQFGYNISRSVLSIIFDQFFKYWMELMLSFVPGSSQNGEIRNTQVRYMKV
ncbi:hypothetical protein TNCV_3573401 [Trichonephila clavipes]|nr:hypothetical protein TNCV_3573401 [Trichonephila clavipes]